ncbi:hypothetical protein [Calycomorphotria hydatis]|uniref:Uncharacterized protein n=1 Tax=Calycomorphotria hydatis TaxID=2528027 RepID=A0A517TB68_9PLAN|nr:hypothetical protein [Calycomorphotria hydatis]QDT65619.1 hypothetical protein V22_28770 [Calycomorphotria hydatis]
MDENECNMFKIKILQEALTQTGKTLESAFQLWILTVSILAVVYLSLSPDKQIEVPIINLPLERSIAIYVLTVLTSAMTFRMFYLMDREHTLRGNLHPLIKNIDSDFDQETFRFPSTLQSLTELNNHGRLGTAVQLSTATALSVAFVFPMVVLLLDVIQNGLTFMLLAFATIDFLLVVPITPLVIAELFTPLQNNDTKSNHE